jgi:hypothetical protein
MSGWSWKNVRLKNVKSFFQAYSRIVYDKLVGLPEHIQEQVAYRHNLCKDDCFVPNEEGKIGCKYCGCNPFDKAFATRSCNDGERFPDLMNEIEWLRYKKDTSAKKKQQ